MIGPLHKQLGQEFLKSLIQCISASNVDHHDVDTKERRLYNRYFYGFDSDIYYEKLLTTQPRITYENEEFYVNRIQITNVPFYDDLDALGSYKHIWSWCDNHEPVPSECPCLSSDTDSCDVDRDVKFSFLPLSVLSQVHYSGKYLSQPLVRSSYAGGQYCWDMTFVYQQGDINIYATLGPPPRRIHRKYISGHKGQRLLPVVKELDTVVNDFTPDNMWFDDEFLKVLKKGLQSKDKILKYKDSRYELLDAKFCDTDRQDLSCGCSPSSCSVMSSEWGIENLPTETSYRKELSWSSTPEWHMQVQVGLCNDSGFTGRFILKFM